MMSWIWTSSWMLPFTAHSSVDFNEVIGMVLVLRVWRSTAMDRAFSSTVTILPPFPAGSTWCFCPLSVWVSWQWVELAYHSTHSAWVRGKRARVVAWTTRDHHCQ